MTTTLDAQLQQFQRESVERLARLKPSDTIKGLFLRRYVEFFEELGGEALKRRGLSALQERRVLDFLDYPYAGMVRMGVAVAGDLAPLFGGVAPWLDQMGQIATRSYLGSALGRAFLATFSPSPRAILAGMPWAIHTTFTFGERNVTFPSPGRCVFRCRREFSAADSIAGGVRAALEAVGARDIAITIELQDLFNYDLRVSWQ